MSGAITRSRAVKWGGLLVLAGGIGWLVMSYLEADTARNPMTALDRVLRGWGAVQAGQMRRDLAGGGLADRVAETVLRKVAGGSLDSVKMTTVDSPDANTVRVTMLMTWKSSLGNAYGLSTGKIVWTYGPARGSSRVTGSFKPVRVKPEAWRSAARALDDFAARE